MSKTETKIYECIDCTNDPCQLEINKNGDTPEYCPFERNFKINWILKEGKQV